MGEDHLPNNRLINARMRMQSPTGSAHAMSRQELAEAVNAWQWHTHGTEDRLDETDVGRLERGETRWPRLMRREGFRAVLGADTDADLGFYQHRRSRASGGASSSPDLGGDTLATPAGHVVIVGAVGGKAGQEQVELLRRELDDALSEGTMAEASLDDWEQTALRYGRATRDRAAGILLYDLSTDLAELRRAVHRHRSSSALRRLTRVAAHMSGLMCLTLCKLDDRPAFRRWARTARLAADEAGDPETRSWVMAQEAYGHYYSGDLSEAVDLAERAQNVVATTPCVGAALAAALEGRAHAAMGRYQQTRAALGQAEDVLSHLSGDSLAPSAFGYNQAQLRFHEGSAYTHLGHTHAAFAAQDRALELCAPGDFTDWAMTRLDRARCLATVGDAGHALAYATETLAALNDLQRQGIIAVRGHELLSALPKDQRGLPAARDLHDLLMLTTERKEAQEP